MHLKKHINNFITEELAAEVADRKHHFATMDMDKKANEGLNDLELEAKKENEYLLEKARIAKIEQEDRIKKLNELIVDAKVSLASVNPPDKSF